MAAGYFNPRPAGGAFGGATTVVDPQYQQPPSGLPGWLVPAGLAATGAGAIGGGLALRHLAQQVPTATPAPFNVGYGNGIAQQAGTTAQQQVQQFSAQALQDRLLAQQQAAQFVNQAPVTDLGRGISPADIRVNPVSIPQGAGVGTGTPSMANLYGSNPYAEAAGVAPASSLPGGVSGIYNFANAPGQVPAALSTGEAAGGLFKGMFSGQMQSGPLAGLSAPLAEDAGYLSKFGKSAASGGIARIGLGVALPYLGSAVGHEFDQAGMTQAGQESRGLGRVAGLSATVGGVPGAIAALPAYAGTEGLSNTQFGNDVLNTVRGSRSGVDISTGQARDINPLAKVASVLNPLAAGAGAINALGQLTGLVDKNREATADTVSDVMSGGGGPRANAAPQITPEQRLAQTSPDSLTKLASDYGLSGPMTQKLIKNYNQELVMAKQQGYVTLPVDKDGKVDGQTKVEEYPGAKKITDAKGNSKWVSTNPADIQQAVFDRATQLVPSLGHAQDQEEDFFRKQAVMQAQLEAAMPTLYNAPSWAGDPTAQNLAMAEARAIPSRYVQAQAMQQQQAYNNQIAQAMQQQQLAQQYPELFGKKSSSGQPTTLDAAMAQ